MTLYDNRSIRIRALGIPMTQREQQVVKEMLLGFDATISDQLVSGLAEVGIRIDTLNNGRRYIAGVEE